MMKRWMAMGMALCLTAASLAGCSGTKDAAESTQAEAETSAEEETAKESDLDKLTFTYVTSPLNVPTIIEKNQGIFEKTFGDMGIEVDYAELTSGADQTQALASGDVQVLYAVGGTSVILSAANGADIKVLNMYSRSPKAFCMYSKDESLTTPESLRGKTIAGPTGTNLHELLVSYLATAGMTIDDVNYVNMSIPDAKAGLRRRLPGGNPAALHCKQLRQQPEPRLHCRRPDLLLHPGSILLRSISHLCKWRVSTKSPVILWTILSN